MEAKLAPTEKLDAERARDSARQLAAASQRAAKNARSRAREARTSEHRARVNVHEIRANLTKQLNDVAQEKQATLDELRAQGSAHQVRIGELEDLVTLLKDTSRRVQIAANVPEGAISTRILKGTVWTLDAEGNRSTEFMKMIIRQERSDGRWPPEVERWTPKHLRIILCANNTSVFYLTFNVGDSAILRSGEGRWDMLSDEEVKLSFVLHEQSDVAVSVIVAAINSRYNKMTIRNGGIVLMHRDVPDLRPSSNS